VLSGLGDGLLSAGTQAAAKGSAVTKAAYGLITRCADSAAGTGSRSGRQRSACART